MLKHYDNTCLVDIPGKPALFSKEMEEDWIWGKGEVGVRVREERREENSGN